MTFEEWWDECIGLIEYDPEKYSKGVARVAWEYSWDQQQRVIDEMHLQFKDYLCPECRTPNFRHKMDCGRGR